MKKLYVVIDDEAFEAVKKNALAEYRTLRFQAGFLIREALEKRGVLQKNDALGTSINTNCDDHE